MKGFTLLEVLIALGITALLTAAVYAAYAGNLEAIEQVRDQEVAFQTARVVLDRMARDLESAVTGATSGVTAQGRLGMVASTGEIAGRSADRVDFTAFSHLAWREGSPKSDLCEVGYSLEPDQDTGEMRLFRREQILPDGDLEAGGEKIALSEDVAALEIHCEDEEGNEVEAWDTRKGDGGGPLPRTIRVGLTVRGVSGSEAVFSTRVHPILGSRGNME